MPSKSKFNTIQLTNKPEIIKRTLEIKSNSNILNPKLSGFLLLKSTKNELPHEVVFANISSRNVDGVVNEDCKVLNLINVFKVFYKFSGNRFIS